MGYFIICVQGVFHMLLLCVKNQRIMMKLFVFILYWPIGLFPMIMCEKYMNEDKIVCSFNSPKISFAGPPT